MGVLLLSHPLRQTKRSGTPGGGADFLFWVHSGHIGNTFDPNGSATGRHPLEPYLSVGKDKIQGFQFLGRYNGVGKLQ
jgi:hypothetical protein